MKGGICGSSLHDLGLLSNFKSLRLVNLSWSKIAKFFFSLVFSSIFCSFVWLSAFSEEDWKTNVTRSWWVHSFRGKKKKVHKYIAHISLFHFAFAFMFTLEWNSSLMCNSFTFVSCFCSILSLVVTSLNRFCVHFFFFLLTLFLSVSYFFGGTERNLHQGFVVGHFW